MMKIAAAAQETLPARAICSALGLARATYYRTNAQAFSPKRPPKAFEDRQHPRALSSSEKHSVREALHGERFMDLAPAQVYAQLLDEGRYLCSIRTMYRILRENGESRERRALATHPRRKAPELCATAPNQVWTWDITHLRTHVKGASIKLYVCMDLYSRFVVGWYLSPSESTAEASHFLKTLAQRENIEASELIIHADNGGPMRGRALADLLESLGIERSHSRPRTSNDNAFSESQFKTMKYRPTYPKYFETETDARTWCREFFAWYNNDHRHESLALLTPGDVYTGRVENKLAARNETLAAAFEMHPERFVKGAPTAKKPPTEVSLNQSIKPLVESTTDEATQRQEVVK